MLTLTEAADSQPEKCSTCGGPMIVEEIDGHDSWVCDKDGTAWAVDQEWAYGDLEE